MSLIPAFDIGIWNAWIFMIWLLLQNFGVRLGSKDLYQRAGQPPDMKSSQKYKIINFIYAVVAFSHRIFYFPAI